jgi:hypothetical protein
MPVQQNPFARGTGSILSKRISDQEAQLMELEGVEKTPSKLDGLRYDAEMAIKNPEYITQEQMQDLFTYLHYYGEDDLYNKLAQRIRPTMKEHALALAGGVADSRFALGAARDEWYSPNPYTEGTKNIGKLIGTALALFGPKLGSLGSIGSSKKGATAVVKSARAYGTAKNSKQIAGMAKQISAAEKAVKVAAKSGVADDAIAAADKLAKLKAAGKAIQSSGKIAAAAKELGNANIIDYGKLAYRIGSSVEPAMNTGLINSKMPYAPKNVADRRGLLMPPQILNQ